MRSNSSSLNIHCFSSFGLLHPSKLQSFIPFVSSSRRRGGSSNLYYGLKLNRSNAKKRGRPLRHGFLQVSAGDEDSVSISSLDDWGDAGTAEYVFSSSDGEDNEGEIVLNPVSDIDLPAVRVSNEGALTVTAHRLAMMARGRRKHRIYLGFLINLGIIIFLTVILLFVDWCGWKIVRLPLAPFYLTRPFFISAFLASCAGYVCVPLLKSMKFHQIIRKEGPSRHSRKKSTPTMGGLFFIPIGVCVAKTLAHSSSVEVSGAAGVTLAYAAIGLLDDMFILFKKQTSGLSAWLRLLLEAVIGILFSFWMDAATLSSPYGMYIFL